MRTASWSTIGMDVTKAKTLNSVLEMSGLDYEVEKCDLFTTLDDHITSKNAIKFPKTVATVNSRTGDILGIVSRSYEVCNNSDAFDFINYIDEDIKYKKAGQTHSGLVYIIAKLPELTILGDKFEPHVIFQNGHNGGIPIKATISPLRIVCQNQFNMAFQESENTISIRHTSSMQSKLADAREILKGTADYMKTLNDKAEKWASIKLTDAQISRIMKELFPIKDDMPTRTVNRIEDNISRFMQAYNSEDNANFRKTLWGLINAEADYLTHNQPARKTNNWDEKNFMCVTFNPYAMARFMQIASSVV